MGKRVHCRLCGSGLGGVILDLGNQPPSNDFYIPGSRSWMCKFPLQLVECPTCSLLQLNWDVDPESIFDPNYPLHSSRGSKEWLEHAKHLAGDVSAGVTPDSLVMEIGSNDGYLLRNLTATCKVLGVDPSGISADVPTVRGFFNTKMAQCLPRADVVLALNTVAQIPDLKDFVQALALVVKPHGCAILEFPDIVKTLMGGQFDQIYHEHYSYLSLTALQYGLKEFAGMHISMALQLPTHGGSLRVYVRHGPKTDEHFTVTCQKTQEQAAGRTYFAMRALQSRIDFRQFMVSCKVTGQKVCAYGAAAKGNTFLNYVNQAPWDGPLPEMIGEVNPAKIGLSAPGTRIPVVSEEVLLASKPNYIVLLAWNWKDECIKRLRELGYKGHFVVAVPDLEIIAP